MRLLRTDTPNSFGRLVVGATLFVFALSLAMSWTADHGDSQPDKGIHGRVLVQEVVSFAKISFQKHEGLVLHRLVIEGRKDKVTDTCVASALAAVKSILDRGKPFVVHYDIRSAGMVLTRSQLWQGIYWTRENAAVLNARLQCISVTMKPGVLKSVVWFFVKVNSPPQPIHVGTSEESALAFARERCQESRDWSHAKKAKAARSRWQWFRDGGWKRSV